MKMKSIVLYQWISVFGTDPNSVDEHGIRLDPTII